MRGLRRTRSETPHSDLPNAPIVLARRTFSVRFDRRISFPIVTADLEGLAWIFASSAESAPGGESVCGRAEVEFTVTAGRGTDTRMGKVGVGLD
jgi:hypothetical protein